MPDHPGSEAPVAADMIKYQTMTRMDRRSQVARRSEAGAPGHSEQLDGCGTLSAMRNVSNRFEVRR